MIVRLSCLKSFFKGSDTNIYDTHDNRGEIRNLGSYMAFTYLKLPHFQPKVKPLISEESLYFALTIGQKMGRFASCRGFFARFFYVIGHSVSK